MASSLFLVKADGRLGLVEDALARAAVLVAVVAAADLVADLLAGGLGVVALETTVKPVSRGSWQSKRGESLPSELVTSVGEGLLGLLLGALGGVGGELLLSLCKWGQRECSEGLSQAEGTRTGREILAAGVRHDC